MKIGWANSIILSFVFFMSFIGYLVYGTFQENIDLVAEDYYQQEVVFQEVIDKSNNYKGLNKPFIINETDESIELVFPHDSATVISGEVYFLRSSDKTKDLHVPVKEVGMSVSKTLLIKGLYNVKITWHVDKVDYYYEQSLFVQK